MITATPSPPGWLEGKWFPDNPIGFSAGWYRKGNEIVISITGTNQTLDWFLTNLGAGIGLITPQLMQAALLYKRIERENPGAQISFTGHSLGGGIASVLAVWFNREATIFAPAPFENAAFNATAFFVPGKSQSARDGAKSQSPEYGPATAANDGEWRRVA